MIKNIWTGLSKDLLAAAVFAVIFIVFIARMLSAAYHVNKRAAELNTATRIASHLLDEIKFNHGNINKILEGFSRTSAREIETADYIMILDMEGNPSEHDYETDMFLINLILRPEHTQHGYINTIIVDVFIYRREASYQRLIRLRTAQYSAERWVYP
jgi:hypothetical protein